MADGVMELTPEMKAAIGKSSDPVTQEVTTLGIRTFARAVGYTNPIYYDEAAAKAKGHPALVAPPGHFGMAVYNPQRGGGGMGMGRDFPSPFTRNLDGGREVIPEARIYAGDILEAVTTLVNLEIVPSRAYGQMMIRTSETVFTRKSDGKVVGRTRSTGISY